MFVDGDWQQQHVQIKAQAPATEELNELEKELLRMSSLKMAPSIPSSRIATPFQGGNGDKPSGDLVGDDDVGGNGGGIVGAGAPSKIPSSSGRASPRRVAEKKGGKRRQQGVLDKQAVAARYIQSLESSFQAYLEPPTPPPAPASLGSASSGSSLGTKDHVHRDGFFDCIQDGKHQHAAGENTQILGHAGSVILHFNDPSPPTSGSKKPPPIGPTSGSKRV